MTIKALLRIFSAWSVADDGRGRAAGPLGGAATLPSSSRGSGMPDIVKDTRYLRTKEAAHYVGLSARTLEKHRTYGTGPAYRKVGGRVLYSIEELRAWVDRGQCTSTSDPNNNAVPPAIRQTPDAKGDGS